jgi:hypothetical protein
LDASRHQTVMEGCLFWGLWGSDAKKFSSHKGFPGQPMMCFSCDLVTYLDLLVEIQLCKSNRPWVVCFVITGPVNPRIWLFFRFSPF